MVAAGGASSHLSKMLISPTKKGNSELKITYS